MDTLTSATTELSGLFGRNAGNWEQRLAAVVETMREMSEQTDPQEMVAKYRNRLAAMRPTDAMVSLSRRNLDFPQYRITRSSRWQEDINPWQNEHRLPVLEGGLLGELMYGDEPRIIDDVVIDEDDPGREFLQDCRSLVAIPNYDGGIGMNMVVLMKSQPAGFDREQFPELVWMSNLFGRATHNLVLGHQVRTAYNTLDYETRKISELQKSMLPGTLPDIPTLDLAAMYRSSSRAGGDYYDLFELPEGKWGILIADVSGHGTSAAVLMAITHSIFHGYCGNCTCPVAALQYANRRLTSKYTGNTGRFVTAFYGVYDQHTRRITYSSAGHPAPRLKRCQDGSMDELNGAVSLPLGIDADETYQATTHDLQVGDQLIFYTDGITEAANPYGQQFGTARLDKALEECRPGASHLIEAVLTQLAEFTQGQPADDDRTLLLAKVK
jgi:sigma-B regulation protein RsbU (phosphoserine phosphatase)